MADFLTQFGRVLGVQALTLVQLQQLLGLQSIQAALDLQQPPQGSPSPVPAQAGAVVRQHKQEPGSTSAPAEGQQGAEAPPQGRAGSQSPALPGAATWQQDQAPGSSPAPAAERQEPQAPQKAAMKEADAGPIGVAAGHRARQPMAELENGESSSGRHTGSTKAEPLDFECTDVLHAKVESLQQAQAGAPRQHVNGFAQRASALATHQQQLRTSKLEHAVRAAVGVQEGNGLLHEDSSRASIRQEPGPAGQLEPGPGEGRLASGAEGRPPPVLLDSPADEGRMVPTQQMRPPAVEGRQSPAQQLHLPAAERKQSPGQQLRKPATEGWQSPVMQPHRPAAQKQHHNLADDRLRQQPPSAEVRPAADETGACPQPQWLWKVYQGLLSHLLPVSCRNCMLCLFRGALKVHVKYICCLNLAQAGSPAHSSVLPPVHWCWQDVQLPGSCLSTCAPSTCPAAQQQAAAAAQPHRAALVLPQCGGRLARGAAALHHATGWPCSTSPAGL